MTVLALVMTAPALADPHPNLRRGSSGSSFSSGGIDSVNPFNGNLTLSVPLGMEYSINDGLSYSLTLAYNSNVWDFQEWSGTSKLPTILAFPSRTNAGLGWSLSLGRLLSPTHADNDTGAWLYISPGGSERLFYDRLHPEDDADAGVLYTRDGSYLRLQTDPTDGGRGGDGGKGGDGGGSSDPVVEFSDGTRHTFQASDGLLSRIEDRFGNALNVQFGADRWTLSDGHRSHTIRFHSQGANPYGRVDWVDLAAFDGTPARYSFSYSQQTIPRPCPHNDGTAGPNATVHLLVSVGLPDGSSYQMPATDHHLDGSAGCRLSGKIKGITLPTLGRTEWTYQDYGFPAGPEVSRQSTGGVATRLLRTATGAVQGQWSYSPVLSADERELVNTVATPNGRIRHYFSVAIISGGGWQAEEYGLPITHAQPMDGGFLSTEILSSNWTLLRRNFLLFEADTDAGSNPPALLDKINVNRRVSFQRTRFVDDGNRFGDVAFNDWDGLGHHRVATTGGNFDSGNTRTVTTNFNQGHGTYPAGGWSMLEPTEPWLLSLYTHRDVAEGGVTARTEFCFDQTTGFLDRIRVLENGTTRGTHDVATTFSRSAGPVINEVHYGGDSAIGTGGCGSGLSGNQYWVKHTYQYGSLESSQYLNGVGSPLGFLAVDLDIDSNTGLVETSRDTAGYATDFLYDDLGRLTWAKPDDDSWVQYVWSRATSSSSLAAVDIYNRPNGGGTPYLAESALRLDAFGRVNREKRRMPDGTFPVRWRGYDNAGNLYWLGQWGDSTIKTWYLNYDTFGRPGKVRPPEGSSHDITLSYGGVRELRRTVKVAGPGNTEVSATTTERYDRQGRLYQVVEPSGASGANVTTTYGYDVGGRLKSVSGSGQSRTLSYDNRGFLEWERHPEKGPSGNGYVVYCDYDAMGRPGRTIDARTSASCSSQAGAWNLTYDYDRVGLLTQVAEGEGAQRPLKVFSYLPNRKLDQAERFNYVKINGTDLTIRVVEDYAYTGRQGRVSSRDTEVFVEGASQVAFDQGWTWDELGNVATTIYPDSTTTNDPARILNHGYSKGWLTSVSLPGAVTSITYHPSGMMHQVAHVNGVTVTQAEPSYKSPRPASISTSGVTAGNDWSTGTYAYDGAGNVKGIGGSWFEYDKVSRLTSATVYDGLDGAGTAYPHSFTYDTVGNLTSLSPGLTVPVSSTTNRLTGAGNTYDPTGNQTAWNGNTYEYGPFGELWHLRTAGASGEDWFYAYTADDERIWSKRYTSFDNFENLWAVRDLDGKILRTYGPDFEWDQDYIYRNRDLLATLFPNGAAHFDVDHLGTPRLVTGGIGEKVAYHVYRPFGQEITSTGQDDERMKFTGHERDLIDPSSDQDDLDYMHARHYNMQLGRFLQVDPVGGSPWAPQTWNRYSYVLGNPLKYVDRYGLFEDLPTYEEEIIVTTIVPRGGLNPLPPYVPPGGNGGGRPPGTPISPSVPTDPFADLTLVDLELDPIPFESSSEPDEGCSVFDSFGACVAKCSADQLGVRTLLGAGTVAAGQPLLSKPFLTRGASPGTSLASQTLSRALPQKLPFRVWAPTTLRPLARSRVLGRILGRWVPFAGWGLLGADAVGIANCATDQN